MSTNPPRRGGRDQGWKSRNANDRLKEQWNARVGWSVVAAVALHAGVFGLWPAWDRPDRERGEPLELTPLELVALYEELGGDRGAGAAAVAASDLPDSLPAQPDVRVASEGDPSELASSGEALRERLRSSGFLRPTLAAAEPEPVVEPPQDEEASDGDEAGEIPGKASSTAELTTLPEPSSLDLDRLSALRPELALMAPSTWVLIRNPTEVERFMRRTYRRGDLSRAEQGSVSVALWIDERGSVEWAEINESSGRSTLDEVALELFSEVVAFRPARDEGVPVSRSVIFSVRFPWF